MNAITPNSRATDSEIVTEYAVDALRDGRFDLARALTNLAAGIARAEHRPAARTETVHIGGGRTITETKGYMNSASAAPLVRPALSVVMQGPTGNADADLAREEAAATSIMDRPIPPSSRCVAMITKGAQYLPCDTPIYLEQHDERAVEPYWQHIDPALNTHHDAQPPVGHAF